MKVLVIYELIPEDTNIYVVDVTDVDELEMLKRAHGNYGNIVGQDDEATDWISEWIGQHEKLDLTPGEPIPIQDCELLIHSGFML